MSSHVPSHFLNWIFVFLLLSLGFLYIWGSNSLWDTGLADMGFTFSYCWLQSWDLEWDRGITAMASVIWLFLIVFFCSIKSSCSSIKVVIHFKMILVSDVSSESSFIAFHVELESSWLSLPINLFLEITTLYVCVCAHECTHRSQRKTFSNFPSTIWLTGLDSGCQLLSALVTSIFFTGPSWWCYLSKIACQD